MTIQNVCMHDCTSRIQWVLKTDGLVRAELRCIEEDHLLAILYEEAIQSMMNGDDDFRIHQERWVPRTVAEALEQGRRQQRLGGITAKGFGTGSGIIPIKDAMDGVEWAGPA